MGTFHCSWQFSGRCFFWIEKELGVPLAADQLAEVVKSSETLADLPSLEYHSGELFSPLRANEFIDPKVPGQKSRLVPGFLLSGDESLAILTTGREFFPPDLEFGSSFLFWREAACFLLEMLCRGRFLPGVSRSEGMLSSIWFPVLLDEAALSSFRSLTERMPLVGCAPIDGRSVHPEAAEQALRDFLDRGTDTLVRLFLPRTRPLYDGSDATSSHNRRVLERWFEALWQKDSGRFAYLEPGLQGFVDKIARWQEVVQPFSLQNFGRVLFRLEALPESLVVGENTFTLTFGMLEGERLFRPWERSFQSGAQNFQPSDEEGYFLRVLAQEAKVFSPLRRVLNNPFPTSVVLTTGEAYDFLKNVATQIEASGHRVELPRWWSERTESIGLRLQVHADDLPDTAPPSLASGEVPFLARQSLLGFSWRVAVGEVEMSIEEFEALSQRGVPFFRVGDRWVELEGPRVNKTLAFVKKLEEKKKLSLFEVLRLGLDDEDLQQCFPILDVRSSGWVRHLFERENHPIPSCEVPESFHGELRKYQREGVDWLWFLSALGFGGCLADDMGLGKTVQLLALLSSLRVKSLNEKRLPSPTLLVVPVSIISNWTHEISRFTPNLRWHVHHGTERLQGRAFIEAALASDIVITSYNLVYRDETSILGVPWGVLVLDEAQNIKNPETKQTQALRRLSSRSTQRFALTGTPLENRLEELWSIMEFLNPGMLGTLGEFRKHFLAPSEREGQKTAIERLSRIVRPFVLRRVKSDPKILPDLPEKIEMNEIVPLTREQAHLYQAVLEEMLPELEHSSGMRRRGLVLATLTRLKQVCNHPALYLRDQSSLSGRSQKLERLEQLLEEIFAEGDKVLLFTQYAEMGKLLRPYLAERFSREVIFLHGAVNKSDRDDMVKRFQERNGPSLFVLSLKAGGFGLNLTEANHVIHYDQWWNPAVEDQASDRAHRIGQTRRVQVRRLLCQGTLEERIAELHIQKRKLVQEVLHVQDDALTELSFTELKQLFELQPEKTSGYAEAEEVEAETMM